jgi:aspartyl-tRNA(Asn)/glutamyl-tRNA(Gln) amidotransferase subunit B
VFICGEFSFLFAIDNMTIYEPVIGLEIHAELRTKSKMFCGCSAAYAEAPAANTLVCPVCTALPGAMPVVNKKAMEQAILVGLALNCTINSMNQFARKNYFYPDLPKGYQISQYDLPVASGGWLDILAETTPQRVRIRRAHLEEDTAKLFHQEKCALVDYNRAGVPLLEIVSEPDLHTIEAVLAYATGIRAILHYLGVNSGDMEKGVLRFESNVSLRPLAGKDEEPSPLRTRTEIKNLNSFRALERATTYEIKRQIKLYESGGEVIQETLGWDDIREITLSQRSKEEAHDYRYFPEPDLPPIEINRGWVDEIKAMLPELPEARSLRFTSTYGLTGKEAALLTSDKSLADYFEKTVSLSNSPVKIVNNWITGEFLRHVRDLGLDLDAPPVPPVHLARLVDLVTGKVINENSGKVVLKEMFETGQAPTAIVEARNLTQVSDRAYLEGVVAQILAENLKEVASYLAGKETVFQWLMGQVAHLTRGKADPQVARELLLQALSKMKDS